MKVKIIAVGKIKEKYLKLGIQEFTKRLSPYAIIDIVEVNDEKAPENLSDNQLRKVVELEGDKILSKIDRDDHVIALAIQGRQKSSESLADYINNLMTYGTSKICFVIGGSNGLGENVYNRANELISFSKFTFPHQLMRLILLEQIYRAFKIMKNEPYHK